MDSAKFEDMAFLHMNTSEYQGTFDNIHDIGPRFMKQSMVFTNGQLIQDQPPLPFNYLIRENFESFRSNHGLSVRTPLLDMELDMDSLSSISYLESCPTPINFVDPLQTTFTNMVDFHSLIRPLDFQNPASDCITDLPSQSSTALCPNPAIRQPISDTERSSAALQRAQAAESHTAKRTRKHLQRQINSGAIPSSILVLRQRAADKSCPWLGCGQKFSRQEHLNRHERTHTREDSFVCKFCNHPFNRLDNMKAHMELHGNPDSKQTKFYPDARAAFEARQDRRRERAKAKATPPQLLGCSEFVYTVGSDFCVTKPINLGKLPLLFQDP